MEASLAVTALMQTDLMREAGVEMADLQDIGEEFDEFEYFFVQACVFMGMFLDMKDTGSGGGNDVIEFAKVVYEKGCAISRQVFETGVGHGLTAARLIGRINDLAAEFFQ
jgi:hypothetical protein